MNNEKQLIRWEKHYSDGSAEYTDEESAKNFKDNLSCVDGLIVTRSYMRMKPVKWHPLEQKLNKTDVMLSLPLLKTENFGEAGWTAQLEGVAGMVTQGETEEEAINELMISIKVMLLYKRGNGA